MEIDEKLNNDLQMVQRQIEKFDSKANSLIAIVSFIFAMSLGMIDVFNQISLSAMTQKIFVKYVLLIIFSVLYFIFFILEIGFLISVIYPRKKTKSKINSLAYYLDVAQLTNKEIKQQANKRNDLDTIIDQLKINSKICVKKHQRLVIAIWLLIPLFLFMFALFFTVII